LQGRDYAIPDDVKYVAPMVLNHRIIIRGQALGGSRRVPPDQFIREKVLMRVEAPK
jgi:MoxR-like ATPase